MLVKKIYDRINENKIKLMVYLLFKICFKFIIMMVIAMFPIKMDGVRGGNCNWSSALARDGVANDQH